MGQNPEDQKDVVFYDICYGTSFFHERDFISEWSVFHFHESGRRNENDCTKGCENLFCGVSADGDEPADIILFAVSAECQKITVHFVVAKCYFKQCSDPCFSNSVWWKQFVDGNAGSGNCGAVP